MSGRSSGLHVRLAALVLLAAALVVLALGFQASFAAVPSGVYGTLIGMTQTELYSTYSQPFCVVVDDGRRVSFDEWPTFSSANPTVQGRDGILRVYQNVGLSYYIGYAPDYSKGRFSPGFMASEYTVEADRWIVLQYLPYYCPDVAGVMGSASAVYSRPTDVDGSVRPGSVMSFVAGGDDLSKKMGVGFEDKVVVVSVTVADGVASAESAKCTASYTVRIMPRLSLSELGELQSGANLK